MTSPRGTSAVETTRTANSRRPFNIQADLRDGIATVTLCGELDIAALPALTQALEQLPAHLEVEFDCTKLAFLDARGLGTLIEHTRTLTTTPRLHNASLAVRRLLHLTGTEQLFSLTETHPAAGLSR